jgi:hypothetical protein
MATKPLRCWRFLEVPEMIAQQKFQFFRAASAE